MKLRFKHYVFTVVTLFVIFGALETFLTVAGVFSPKVRWSLTPPEYLRIPLYYADPILGHRPNPGYPSHDRNGWRNEHLPHKAFIVAMGDSQTYGYGVEPQDAWPKQLATKINREVYSLAFGGYGPAHYLELWNEAINMAPDVVIEGFYAGNDLFDSYSLVYLLKQLRELRSELQVVKQLSNYENVHPFIEELGSFCAESHAEFIPQAKTSLIREFLSRYSKLYGLFRWGQRARHQSREAVWQNEKSLANKNPSWCQTFERDGFRTIFTSRYRLRGLDLSDPRIAEGYRISLEAIRRSDRLARQFKKQFLVVLIPTKELVFKELAANVGGQTYEKLIDNESRMWTGTKIFLQKHKIKYVDTLPNLKALLTLKTQPYPDSTDGHPNRVGHTAIASAVASFITANYR